MERSQRSSTFFKSQRVCVQQLNPVQNRTARAPKSASLLQLRRHALIGQLHTSSYPHTHRESQHCFFPSHISYPFARSLSFSRFTSLTLPRSLYLLVSFSLPLHLQPGEAHVFSTVSSAGSVWFKAIMWLQKET